MTKRSFKLTGSDYAIRKFCQQGRDTQNIRSGRDIIYLHINTDEEDWLHHTTKSLNLTAREVDAIPDYAAVACGQLFVLDSHVAHERNCNRCRSIQGRGPIIRNQGQGEVKTLLRLPALADHGMDLDGLISLLAQRRDEALEIAQQLDTVLVSIQGIHSIQERLDIIQKEEQQYRKALRLFMEEPNSDGI